MKKFSTGIVRVNAASGKRLELWVRGGSYLNGHMYAVCCSANVAELADAILAEGGVSPVCRVSELNANLRGFATQADFDEMYEQVLDRLCMFGM